MNYSQFVPVIRRLNPRTKIVLHMQCEWLTQVDRSCIAARLTATDLVLGCSEYITATIADAFPEFAERCVTVPNAAVVVPEAELGHSASQDVLFVGRVSPEKGIHDLIAAFHGVLKRFPEARLRIVGGFGSAPLGFLVGLSNDPTVAALRRFYERPTAKDPYPGHLEAAAGPELGKRIIFEGKVKYTATTEFYRKAAVLVNPSLSEFLRDEPGRGDDARAPGRGDEGRGDDVHREPGKTGHLVAPADPSSLADAICDLLQHPARARAMGVAGRRRAVEKFSWGTAADILLKHYEGLVTQRV